MSETAQQKLRRDLIDATMRAIANVRDNVALLNDREKEYLRHNSVSYRQLVEAISKWAWNTGPNQGATDEESITTERTETRTNAGGNSGRGESDQTGVEQVTEGKQGSS